MKNIKNESGIAHLGLIAIIAVVVIVGAFAYWRVSSNKKTLNRTNSNSSSQTDLAQTLPTNLEGLKTQEEIKQTVGATSGTDIVEFVLESKDGGYIYKVVLSNGKKLVVDAKTGKVLSEESTTVSDSKKIPAGVKVNISSDQAYRIAAGKHSSPIKTIEMEVEDKKVVYKIEYRDGSKIEIDATSGAIIKSEIKGTEDNKDEDDHDSEDDDTEDDDKDEDR